MQKRFSSLIVGLLLANFAGTECGVAAERLVSAQSSQNKSSVTIQDQEWKDAKRNREIPVKLYIPAPTGKPSPIVIFSHGLGGSREAASYLGEYLAGKGYLCVHLQHPGSDTDVARQAMRAGFGRARATLAKAANGENLQLRVQDVSFAIDELERRSKSDPLLRGRIDLSKIAIAGHSFGAGTSLAICGQSYGLGAQARTVSDPRVKVGIYLSPPVNMRGRDPAEVFSAVKIPGLLMTGTEDSSPIGETDAADRRVPFDGISAPHQYLVNYIGGDHAIFAGQSFKGVRPGDDAFHQSINKVCGEFLDAYLLNDAAAQIWMNGGGAAEYLANTAKFEKK